MPQAQQELAISHQEQAALHTLVKQVEKYGDTKAGTILALAAKKDAQNQSLPIGNRLLRCGLYLLHCSVQKSDGLVPTQQVGNAILLSDYNDIAFVQAVGNAASMSRSIVERRGKMILDAASQLYDQWFQGEFGMPFDEEAERVMFRLQPLVMRWDHHLENRPIFGSLWGIPRETYPPLFGYLKMQSYPPTCFVSDQEENDMRSYTENIAQELGQTREEVLNLSTAHEDVHNMATNQVSDMCLPNIWHWWGEAVAVTYTDIQNYQRRLGPFYESTRRSNVNEIMEAQNGIDYTGSLATWLAFSSLKAGSLNPSQIYSASDELVSQMIRYASSGRKILPKDIPTVLFFTSNTATLLEAATQRKLQIAEMLQAGQF